tara:strand:+ start:1109 stop:1552 length:444 start_codon:yes stop_codon:yes gene_type:complete
MAGRPKQFDLGIQTSVYIEHEHKKYLESQGMGLSAFIRDVIGEAMKKIDIYKELQELREQLVKSKNENLELLKEIDNMNKAKKKEQLEQAEAEKMKLMPNDEKILENPTEFLKWLDLYDNYTISEQSFISKVGMTSSRARRLKEEYL